MRKITWALITVLLLGVKTIKAQEQTLSASEPISSGCLSQTRGTEAPIFPTIKLTKEGDILSVDLLNYSSNCGTRDFEVENRLYDGNSDNPSVVISVTPVIPAEADCICPFNISYTVRGLEKNSFYLTCWWYDGPVELTEGEPLVLEYEIIYAVLDGLTYRLLKTTHQAQLIYQGKWNNKVERLQIPSEIEYGELKYTVTSIDESVFSSNTNIKEIIIPKTVKNIEFGSLEGITSNPFSGCLSLETIEVEEGNPAICSVDGVLFNKDKTNLLCYPTASPRELYTVPDGVKRVATGAFFNNQHLRKIVLPDNLESLGYSVFANSKSLEEVILPSNIKELPFSLFKNCTKLKDIYYHSKTVPITGPGAFEGVDLSQITLHVPAKSIDSYKSSIPWNQFGAIVPLETQTNKIEINEQNFPDKEFRNYVMSSAIDRNQNRILDDDEVQRVNVIDIHNKGIGSLKGIEHFTELLRLICYQNNLTELDLSACTKLDTLECAVNKLTKLEITKCTKLVFLRCDQNKFSDLDMSGCTELEQLLCSENKITSLDMSNNTKLMMLYCNNNQLAELNLSKNTELMRLYCNNNQLKELNLSKNAKLECCDCSMNMLTKLTLQKDNMLTHLMCYRNQLYGAAMDHIIENLNEKIAGYIGVYDAGHEDMEKNVCTTTQVAATRAKGWNVFQIFDDEWLVYNGSETSIEYFPEGTKWTEIRLDTLKYDNWYSKVGDEWIPNFETIEYYVKGEYTTKYGDKFKCVYTNGPEWTDSLTLLIQEAEYNGHNSVLVSVLDELEGEPYALVPGEAYQFDWSVGTGIFYTDITMSNTTYIVQYHNYYGIIDEIKEGYFGGVRPLKYVDLDGKAPECGKYDNPQLIDTNGGRIIQGIGITEWNGGECLFGPPDPYFALTWELGMRHYRSMLVHFERNEEVLYDVWPKKEVAYRPFVEEGKVWKLGSTTGISDGIVKMVEYYYFDGDTIIGGKTCKKMMCQLYYGPDYFDDGVISMTTPSSRYVGAWYEEDKKVYYYTINDQLRMMYDFSLEANDTLLVDNENQLVVGPKQTGGLKGFKGVYRDIVWYWSESGNNNYSTTWLEGVGSIYGPTYNVFYSTVCETPFLMSCTVGDEVIYLNDEYEDGATPAEARKRRFDFSHTIKTKPKARRQSGEEQSLYGEYNDQQLGINLDPLVDAYQVRITDESGKLVYEKAVNAGSIVGLNIDISAYAKGRYTVTVENSQESFTGQFETQATGIQELKNSSIEKSKSIYNLQGQRLNSLQKGLNIVNGRKVYVK